jgi:cell division protein FtsW
VTALPWPRLAPRSYRGAIIGAAALLTAIGLVAIYAASSLKGAQQFHDEFLFLRKQAISAGLGFAIIAVVQVIPFHWIQRATLPLLALAIGLLALIFVPGMYSKVGGASRWLNLPIIGGQPSELAKLALILFLARNLSRPSSDVESFTKGILPNLLVFALIAGLLLVQKDLGTPVLLFSVTFLMLLVAGVGRRFVTLALGLALTGVVGAVIVEPYRVARIMSFLDPWATIKGSGFQIIQSFLAFRNGGLLGAGLGESRQKLFFLPEAHTDFILSVIGEELGLVGVLLVVALFAYLTFVGYRITAQQTEPYKKFLGFGLTTVMAIQGAVNMGVAMGLLPTKGIPLPFVSSGNSSLLAYLTLTALLARLAKDPAPEAYDASARPSAT